MHLGAIRSFPKPVEIQVAARETLKDRVKLSLCWRTPSSQPGGRRNVIPQSERTQYLAGEFVEQVGPQSQHAFHGIDVLPPFVVCRSGGSKRRSQGAVHE